MLKEVFSAKKDAEQMKNRLKAQGKSVRITKGKYGHPLRGHQRVDAYFVWSRSA